jgi:hypothetical protein
VFFKERVTALGLNRNHNIRNRVYTEVFSRYIKGRGVIKPRLAG